MRLALGLALLALLPAAAFAADGGGQRYYLDCAHGDDGAAGTSAAGAWGSLARASRQVYGPGDALLVRRGTTCPGVLAAQGSGSPGAPVTVDAYGRGARPVLAGEGARATVVLHGVEGWELRHLTITDHGATTAPGDERTGIDVQAPGGGGHHYVFEDLALRDINTSPVITPGDTDFENWSKDSGGIIFRSGRTDDVVIADDTFSDVAREGVYLGGPMTGLVIRDNTLRAIGGDGIVTTGSTGARVIGNVVRGFNEQGTSFNAGVWGYGSTDAVFAFNDVSGGRHGPLDSMAYDVDGSNHHLLFEHNFSHDNSGGFLLLCNDVAPGADGAPNGGSVIRFNISQNDESRGRGVIDAPVLCGRENDIWVYNNTVYTRDPQVTAMVENTAGSTLHVLNNILVGPSPHAQVFDQAGSWDGNLYETMSCTVRPADPHAVVGDPLFVAPGAATQRTGAGGYALRVGSPALGAAVPVPDPGARDYFGNPLPPGGPRNIGAYQGPGVSTAAGPLDVGLPPLAPGC